MKASGGGPARPPAMAKRAKFIIHAPSFNDMIGGDLALHFLCHRLNAMGERALLWQRYRPPLKHLLNRRDLRRNAGYYYRSLRDGYDRGPFDNPIATDADLEDSIVVYPEVIEGNPLRARNVVRWFMHRPGHFSGRTGFGPGELYFYFQEAFDDPAINPDRGNRLTLMWLNDAYRDQGRTDRSGSCYLVRKGAGRPLVHDLQGSVRLDGFSHAETAEAFNRARLFYSYDLYTMYSVYAAICGCIPIVVPAPGLSKTDWLPDEKDRYGLAYGEDEIAWALETRSLMLGRRQEALAAEERMLVDFVAKCKTRFGYI